jgi:hypothetical protein
VKVDGAAVGSLTTYFSSGTPTCGQSGTVTVTVTPGAHRVQGESGQFTWDGTSDLVAGQCLLYQLNAPAAGGGTGGGSTGGGGGGTGGGSGGGAATGQLSIWTDYSQIIAIKVDGQSAGSLTQYFSSGTPNCGQAGTLTLTLAAGAHQVTGSSGSTSWNSSATVVAGQCQLYKLNAPAGGGTGGGGSGGGGTGGGGTGGGGSGGGSGSSTGTRVTACGTAPLYANAVWSPLPAPFEGLDVKLYWSNNFSTADVIFRNRYFSSIYFNEEVYRSGAAVPTSVGYRHSIKASSEETPPGPNLGVNVGVNGRACVVVQQVRFGSDTGPYK